MATPISRAEYEAKFGVKPDVSSVTPIKISRAEYEFKFKEPVKPESIIQNRGGSILGTLKDVATLQTSVPVGAFQVAGQVAGGINDVIGKIISPVVNYATDKVSNIPFVQKLANAPTVSKALDITNETLGNVATQYKSWAEKNPNQAKTLESAVNIATLLPIGKGASIAGKTTAGEIARTATKSAIGKVAEPLSASLKTSAEESIMKVLGATTKEGKSISAKLVPQILEKPMSSTFALTRQGLQTKATLGKEIAGQAIEDFGTLKGSTPTAKIISALEAEKSQFIAGNVIVNPQAVSKILKVQGIISQYGKTIDNETLRAVNRIFGKEVAQSKGFALSPAEGTLIDIKKTAYGKIRAILAESQDDVYSKLNKEYSFWSDLEKVVSETNLRTSSQTGFGKDLITAIGAASGDSALGIAVKALTFRWVTSAVKSTGWRLVSARVKNNLAEAIASGNWIAANEQLRELTKNSSFAKQWDKIKNTPNKQGGFINFDEINKGFQSQNKAVKTIVNQNKANKAPATGEIKQTIINNNKTTISKSISPSKIESSLISEAKKYKSAEEFVKAQPKLFHGSKNLFDKFDVEKFGTGEGADKFGKGAYLTDNQKIADFYANATAKKDFVDRYTNTGIFGTPEPVYKTNADILAKQNAKVNEFVAKNLNLLDVSSYKITPDIKNKFIEAFKARGYDTKYASEEVNRVIDYARKNSQKIYNYRGELDYAIMQLTEGNANATNKIIDAIKAKGYDGLKYASDLSYEGKGGTNYVIYNPEKLLNKSQLTDIWNKANGK
jgi:hypothetical protein